MKMTQRKGDNMGMAKMTDKEKVLDFLLHSEAGSDNKIYIAENSFCSIPDVDRKSFARYLSELEYDKLIEVKYSNPNKKDGSSVCWVVMIPPAYSYFIDKAKARKQHFLSALKINIREIILLAIGAVFGGIVTYIVTILTTS